MLLLLLWLMLLLLLIFRPHEAANMGRVVHVVVAVDVGLLLLLLLRRAASIVNARCEGRGDVGLRL